MTGLISLMSFVLCSLTLCFTIGCGGEKLPQKAAGKITVFTTIDPIADLVSKIGGEFVDVQILVPSGRDPHLFEPSPKQMLSLSRASLFFTIGLPLENTLKSKFNQNMSPKFNNIGKGVSKRVLAGHDHHHDHDHGHASCSATDPHIWLGYKQVKVMVANIASQLGLLLPKHADQLTINLAAFLKELDLVHQEISISLKPFKGSSIVVFHPSFGYFTDTYGLKQKSIEFEGKAPTPKRFAELVRSINKEKTTVLFIQPQFNQDHGKSIAQAVGAEVGVLDSLAPDVLANYREMAKNISAALQIK